MYREEQFLVLLYFPSFDYRIFDSRSLDVCRTFPRKQHIQTWCDISHCDNYCITCSNGFQGNGCEATVNNTVSLNLLLIAEY